MDLFKAEIGGEAQGPATARLAVDCQPATELQQGNRAATRLQQALPSCNRASTGLDELQLHYNRPGPAATRLTEVQCDCIGPCQAAIEL
jgi:hypothetical protein